MLSKLLKKNNFKILSNLLEADASLSELARRTKITKARVFYSLQELAELDLFRKKVIGKTHLYSFNYLHPRAKKIIGLILFQKKKDYNLKLKGLPSFIDLFLKTTLKTKYLGCIFFGSSLEKAEFNDLDIFIMLKDFKPKAELQAKLQLINQKLSPVFGTRDEIKAGAKAKDMLYLNILKGLPFSCENFVLNQRYRDYFLRRKDIEERFILGYREILSCLEFKEKEFVKKHLEKGCVDILYAALNYFDLFPRNDQEALEMFKKSIKLKMPNKVEEALAFAHKIGGLILCEKMK